MSRSVTAGAVHYGRDASERSTSGSERLAMFKCLPLWIGSQGARPAHLAEFEHRNCRSLLSVANIYFLMRWLPRNVREPADLVSLDTRLPRGSRGDALAAAYLLGWTVERVAPGSCNCVIAPPSAESVNPAPSAQPSTPVPDRPSQTKAAPAAKNIYATARARAQKNGFGNAHSKEF